MLQQSACEDELKTKSIFHKLCNNYVFEDKTKVYLHTI